MKNKNLPQVIIELVHSIYLLIAMGFKENLRIGEKWYSLKEIAEELQNDGNLQEKASEAKKFIKALDAFAEVEDKKRAESDLES